MDNQVTNSTAQKNTEISVITPLQTINEDLFNLLDSIERQTLDHSLFEVLLVFNGPNTPKPLDINPVRDNYSFEIRAFQTQTASVGAARNIGLSVARGSLITFIDSDDSIGTEFLATGFQLASENSIPLLPMFDKTLDCEIKPSRVHARYAAHQEKNLKIDELPWALGFNACKFLPKNIAVQLAFNPDLKSGEDVVFFAGLLRFPNLEFALTTNLEDRSYIRTLTANSVSRRTDSFEFNVKERIDCISELSKFKVDYAIEAPTIDSLIFSQLSFIQKYLGNHENSINQTREYARKKFLDTIFWKEFNSHHSSKLAFCYCFPPFVDTSGTVAAKRLYEDTGVFDVISNDMAMVRKKDPNLILPFLSSINRQAVLTSPSSFSGWEPNLAFAQKAVLQAERWISEGTKYTEIYSRAHWPGSHLAAALFKLAHPTIPWTAEFSDPMTTDAAGKPRQGDKCTGAVATTLEKEIIKQEFSFVPHDFEFFHFLEQITISMADTIVFTNANQVEVVAAQYPPQTRSWIESKSVILKQPQPPAHAMNVVGTNQQFNKTHINIGYFGNLYANRGLNEILMALGNLDNPQRKRIQLHFFCNNSEQVEKEALQHKVENSVEVHDFVPYLEFLNITSQLDVLLVTDVSRPRDMTINPFLPSKLADYRASKANIWGIIDSGSPLSKEPLDFESRTGDISSIEDTLISIIEKVSNGNS